MHNDHVTPYYIRTQQGHVGYVDTLDEAIAIMAGPEGYRLTLTASDGTEIIIRRSDTPEEDQPLPYETSYEAALSIRPAITKKRIDPEHPSLRVVK